MLGDSSAPLSVLANTFSWCWFENLEQLSSTYLERSQLKDLKYHLNGLLSDNLKKFSVQLLDSMKIWSPVIYLTCIYGWQEDHAVNIQTIVISLKTTVNKLG